MKDYSKLSKEQLIDELILLGDENIILTSQNEELTKQLALYGVVSCFKMEVHSKNGAWYEIVLAKTDTEARKKLISKYPHNTGVRWIDEYPEPIF